jgi:hypothetical protein
MTRLPENQSPKQERFLVNGAITIFPDVQVHLRMWEQALRRARAPHGENGQKIDGRKLKT